MRVQLITDLTKYHPSLVVGSIGTMIGPYGKHSKEFPKTWVGVKFEHYTLDILRKHLEIVRNKAFHNDGPILELKFDTIPKIDQIVDISNVSFKVYSIVNQIDKNTWCVNLRALN